MTSHHHFSDGKVVEERGGEEVKVSSVPVVKKVDDGEMGNGEVKVDVEEEAVGDKSKKKKKKKRKKERQSGSEVIICVEFWSHRLIRYIT